MKITDSLIDPRIGQHIRIWQDHELMKMMVGGHPNAVLFGPNDLIEVRISGEGGEPVNVSTYRVPIHTTEVQTFEGRVIDEKRQLDEKLAKLTAFIDTSPFLQGMHRIDQGLLRDQENVMLKYSGILGLRIARMGNQE